MRWVDQVDVIDRAEILSFEFWVWVWVLDPRAGTVRPNIQKSQSNESLSISEPDSIYVSDYYMGNQVIPNMTSNWIYNIAEKRYI